MNQRLRFAIVAAILVIGTLAYVARIAWGAPVRVCRTGTVRFTVKIDGDTYRFTRFVICSDGYANVHGRLVKEG